MPSNSARVMEGRATSHSPLWRAGFYGCNNLTRLQVTSDETLLRRQGEIDQLLKGAGLKLIGQGTIKYSDESAHGYTYLTGLLQSGAMLHTYPEHCFVTAMFETCGPLQTVIEDTVAQLQWFFGAKKVVFFEVQPLEFPTTAYAEQTVAEKQLSPLVLDARRKGRRKVA